MNQVEDIVKHRLFNLSYLQAMHNAEHDGNCTQMWLNSVHLNCKDIINFYDEDRQEKKANKWFLLALGFGKIISLETARSSLKGCLQLMTEYDYYTSSATVQTMVAYIIYYMYCFSINIGIVKCVRNC